MPPHLSPSGTAASQTLRSLGPCPHRGLVPVLRTPPLPPSQRYETHRHSAWQEQRCKTIPSQLAEDRQPRVAFSCTTPKAQEHVGNTDSLVLSKMPPWL